MAKSPNDYGPTLSELSVLNIYLRDVPLLCSRCDTSTGVLPRTTLTMH